MSSLDGHADSVQLQTEEAKPPGLELTGTQATLTMSAKQGKK